MREFIKSIVGNKYWDFIYEDYDFLFAEQDYCSYYLFYFPTDKEQLVKLQKEAGNIFHAIKENEKYNPDMDKNITCILCLCVEDDEYYEATVGGRVSELSKIVCIVEEDLNYFKKNVLLYTKKMEEFSQKNMGRLESLCREYFTEENFQSYKKSCRDNFEYDFLINLFIKIPFLNFYGYQPGNHKEYQSMETFIRGRLAEKKINHQNIEEMCGELEENIEDEDKFFSWLDALPEEPANEVNAPEGRQTEDENRKS